jgi:hypothetical protein
MYLKKPQDVPTSGGTNPQHLGSAESESLAIFSEIRANPIRIQIPNLKKKDLWFYKKNDLIYQLFLERLEAKIIKDNLNLKPLYVYCRRRNLTEMENNVKDFVLIL